MLDDHTIATSRQTGGIAPGAKPRRPAVASAQRKFSGDSARIPVQFERQLHAGIVGATTAEAVVGGIRFKHKFRAHVVWNSLSPFKIALYSRRHSEPSEESLFDCSA